MRCAIVFWFYKESNICLNRLQLLKQTNPNLKIYGLFGGNQADATEFQSKLGDYLDDFYVAPMQDSHWKWIHGDLVLLDWFIQRGQFLDWQNVAIVQWDMLVCDSIERIFSEMKPNQIFLSGFRSLDSAIERSWDWTMEGKPERNDYLQFLQYVKHKFGYNKPPVCSLFIFEIFPRIFFEKYAAIDNRELGMLEYKIPIYAEIFGLNVYQKDLGVYWEGDWKLYPLNAMPYEISEQYIRAELNQVDGWRIFHPYFQPWPVDSESEHA